MSREQSFRSSITTLWIKLVVLGIIGMIFAEALILAPGKAQGWSFYLTSAEVIFEIVVRLIVAGLVGIVAGTFCTAVVAPFLWHFKESRDRLADLTTRVAVVVVVFLTARIALVTLIKWSNLLAGHREIYETALMASFYLAFAVALLMPRARKEVVTSLDGFLAKTVSRRVVLATVGGTAALVATEFVLSRRFAQVSSAVARQRPRTNVLLVTFDALSAEDMSLYGYGLPTTPNIDAFARKGTVFKNYYSCCTFTTPSVATMMMGIYPSESRVYQLKGQARAADAAQSLPFAMRAAGYANGAFLSNPFAYYLGTGLENGYDVMPEPVFQQGGLQRLWDAAEPLHQDSGVGSRLDEYIDLEQEWNLATQLPSNLSMRYRPAATFEQAREILAKLPDGYFLWVHAVTPHGPYLPDSVDRGRFLPDNQLHTFEEEFGNRWKPTYPPDVQSQVDQRRLRYDEFIATADRDFGAFIRELESSGRLRNTNVIVSADHGESFEGGVYQHSSPYQTRPIIHIPLIIRTANQEESRTVAVTADQTSLAPTILELAGVPKPASMRGPSLLPWLDRDGEGESEGVAFCQYLETNSVFKPLRHGTVGVIDGKSQHQYVLNIDTQQGSLKPLNDAQIWNLDRSAENPGLAEQLRATIAARFPEVVRKPA
jgi:arylsulfatase A-like enzyme